MAASDLCGQVFSGDAQLCAIRRGNMEIGKVVLAGSREPAAVVDLPERQTPVAVEAEPAQRGDVESVAAIGPELVSVSPWPIIVA